MAEFRSFRLEREEGPAAFGARGFVARQRRNAGGPVLLPIGVVCGSGGI
jgi:hypothetical protein